MARRIYDKEHVKAPGTPLSSKEMYQLPGTIEYTPVAKYRFTTGQALSKFLEELKRGRIAGRKCNNCGRVYVPPRMYCEFCYKPTSEWIYLEGTGTVVTAVVSYIGTARERLEKPEIIGIVKLDIDNKEPQGYDFPGLFHRFCNVSEDDVKTGKIIGARVRPRWKPEEERKGDITDIECFEPIEG